MGVSSAIRESGSRGLLTSQIWKDPVKTTRDDRFSLELVDTNTCNTLTVVMTKKTDTLKGEED